MTAGKCDICSKLYECMTTNDGVKDVTYFVKIGRSRVANGNIVSSIGHEICPSCNDRIKSLIKGLKEGE